MYQPLLRLAVHGVAPQQLSGTLIGRRAVLFAEFQTSVMDNWRRHPLICVKLALTLPAIPSCRLIQRKADRHLCVIDCAVRGGDRHAVSP